MNALFNAPLREESVYDDEGNRLGHIEVYPSLHCAFRNDGEKRKFASVGDADDDLLGDATLWIKEGRT